MIASAGGRKEIEKAAESLRVFTDCLPGNRERGVISVSWIWNAGEVKGTKALEQAYIAGNSI